MKFSARHAYDCDVPTLHATLTDGAYLQAKFDALGFREVAVITATPTHVESSRVLVAPLPGFARKVLSDTQTIAQIEDWSMRDDHVDGRFHGAAQGKPITMSGTLHIAPNGAGSQLSVDGVVEVKIPFVGGKVAALVAENTTKNLEKEYEFTRRWLADHAATKHPAPEHPVL
jgi:hypothetical protein